MKKTHVLLLVGTLAAAGAQPIGASAEGPGYDEGIEWSCGSDIIGAQQDSKVNALTGEMSVGVWVGLQNADHLYAVPFSGCASASIRHGFQRVEPGQRFLVSARVAIPPTGDGAPSATTGSLGGELVRDLVDPYAFVSIGLVAIQWTCDDNVSSCGGSGHPDVQDIACAPLREGCGHTGVLTLTQEVEIEQGITHIEIDLGLDAFANSGRAGFASAVASAVVEDITITEID